MKPLHMAMVAAGVGVLGLVLVKPGAKGSPTTAPKKRPATLPEPLWALGGLQRLNTWGPVEYEADPSTGRVRFDSDWLDENIVLAPIPELNRSFKMHRLFVEPFRAWLAEGLSKGLIDPTRPIQADIVPRLSRRHGVYGEYPSSHSYGVAVDLDPDAYPESSTGGPKALQLAKIAAKYNMGWGGLFNDPDPMHFELVVNPEKAVS